MSKYIYTTIYEQFTGLKPPEPKNHKPRRRRGYGHPYRMRLNMHEDVQNEELLDDDILPEDLDPQPQSLLQSQTNHPVVRKTPGRPSTHNRSAAPPSMHSLPNTLVTEVSRKVDSAPKVTYKKRRQYSDPATIA